MHRQLNLKVLNRHQFYRPALSETLSLESIVSTARRSSTLDDNDAGRRVVLAADDDGAAPLGIVVVADAVARRYHRLLRCYLIDYYNELVTVDNSTMRHQMVHRRHRRLHCDDRLSRFAVAEAQRFRSAHASCSDGSERTRRSRRQSSGTQRQQHHQQYLPSPT